MTQPGSQSFSSLDPVASTVARYESIAKTRSQKTERPDAGHTLHSFRAKSASLGKSNRTLASVQKVYKILVVIHKACLEDEIPDTYSSWDLVREYLSLHTYVVINVLIIINRPDSDTGSLRYRIRIHGRVYRCSYSQG